MVILNMMENLLMINMKEMENIFTKMVKVIEGNLKMGSYMAKVYIIMKTEKFVMKVILLMINMKEMEDIIIQMVNII